MKRSQLGALAGKRLYLSKGEKTDHGSIATGNRWTGNPHEHKREIARRTRRGED